MIDCENYGLGSPTKERNGRGVFHLCFLPEIRRGIIAGYRLPRTTPSPACTPTPCTTCGWPRGVRGERARLRYRIRFAPNSTVSRNAHETTQNRVSSCSEEMPDACRRVTAAGGGGGLASFLERSARSIPRPNRRYRYRENLVSLSLSLPALPSHSPTPPPPVRNHALAMAQSR